MKVKLLLIGHQMALLDEKDVILFIRPVSRHIHQEINHQIKTHGYEVVNPEGFPWLRQPCSADRAG